MRSIYASFLCCLIIALSTPVARAQVDELVGKKVMIVDWGVEARKGEHVTRKLELSNVFEVTKTNDDSVWFNDSVGGWVKKQNVVPLEQAIEHFDQLIKKDPSGINFYHRGLAWRVIGNHRSAFEDANQAILRDAPQHGFVLRGEIYSQKKEYKRAVVNYTYALLIDPTNKFAFNARGLAWFGMDEFDYAITDFSHAISRDSQFLDAFNNRACALMRRGDIEKALVDYDQAILREPKGARAFYNRAVMHAKKGEYGKAISDYEKVLRLDSQHMKASANLAWIFATCHDQKWRNGKRAVKLAENSSKVSDRKSDNSKAILSAAYASIGEFEQAERVLANAVEINPDSYPEVREQMRIAFEAGQPYVDHSYETKRCYRFVLDVLNDAWFR